MIASASWYLSIIFDPLHPYSYSHSAFSFCCICLHNPPWLYFLLSFSTGIVLVQATLSYHPQCFWIDLSASSLFPDTAESHLSETHIWSPMMLCCPVHKLHALQWNLQHCAPWHSGSQGEPRSQAYRFKGWHHHLLAMWSWMSCFTFLCLKLSQNRDNNSTS